MMEAELLWLECGTGERYPMGYARVVKTEQGMEMLYQPLTPKPPTDEDIEAAYAYHMEREET